MGIFLQYNETHSNIKGNLNIVSSATLHPLASQLHQIVRKNSDNVDLES